MKNNRNTKQTDAVHQKRFVALARVSSREQEREGFSLDVQVDALTGYAERTGGKIAKLYRIAETASKTDERTTFKEMVEYVKQHAEQLDGMLFYKIDRAARNLWDYVELERLESTHGVPLVAVSQPTENTPAGRMQRRMLASMASFYTEQQSIDVREGHARRVASGLFVCGTPYGYRNERINGRSLVTVDDREAINVRLIFDLYAHHNCTIDMVAEKLAEMGVKYTDATPAWTRSKIARVLHDRAYIGEIRYQNQWLPGSHQTIVQREIWDRVQALMGGRIYKAHEMVYAGSLIRCAHCGNLITGETVTKKNGKQYVYYRCTMYNRGDHPRIRLNAREMDDLMVNIFNRIRQSDDVREWFAYELRQNTDANQAESRQRADELQGQLARLRKQEDELLNLRLLDEIEQTTYRSKSQELRDRVATVTVQLEGIDRSRDEKADAALRVFELSQA
ncbi:MAG: recombinase family protein, partial [Betaproteobacteria bacterium]|nr:recombinase family protein [Betaproteobacteria bacterium]